MAGHGAVGAAIAILVFTLGCAAGELTLPGSGPDQLEAAALVAKSGDGQQAAPGEVLAEPLTVQVLDSTDQPVAGTPVVFSFVGNPAGAVLEPDSIVTGADGIAAATVRLGSAAGEQVIVAEVANSEAADLRTQFSAVAVLPDTTGGGKKGGGEGHGNNEGD